MSQDTSSPEAPQSAAEPAATPKPSKKPLFPTPKVRALSRTALMLATCAFFLILGFVSIRYSRDRANEPPDPGTSRSRVTS